VEKLTFLAAGGVEDEETRFACAVDDAPEAVPVVLQDEIVDWTL